LFDYAEAMRELIADVISCSRALAHIEMSAVLVGCIKARNREGQGLYARTIPLRFEGGSLIATRGKVRIRIPKVTHHGKEALYIISFCLPRFQNLSFEDKLTTIFHELYHISPDFNGDIRRFKGTNYVHSSSQRKYDDLMRGLARDYLAATRRPELHTFLALSYDELCRQHGSIRLTLFRPPTPEIIKEEMGLSMTARSEEKRKKKRGRPA